MITLFLGGARSGKSQAAEARAVRLGRPVTYLATGQASDPEMAARVVAHQQRRPPQWTTIEIADPHPTALPAALRRVQGAVVLDALGTWLARADGFEVDADDLCRALCERSGDTMVVSDEVGLGVHPSTELGRSFRDALGDLNQRVAAVADEVVLVIAGRLLVLDRP